MKNKNGISSITLVIIIGILMIFLIISYHNYIQEHNFNNIQKEAESNQEEFKTNSYIIYFDTDGGQPISPMNATDLSVISNIRAQKADCIFDCWLLDGQPITSFELTQDVTLKAKYNSLKPTKEQLASARNIDYVTLFKGENNLVGNYYSITGEIAQDIGSNIYHVNMTKNGTYYTYYTDRISIEIKGTTSEILMVGDIISFIGKYRGNISYTTVLFSDNKIPSLLVYGENLKVVGHTK